MMRLTFPTILLFFTTMLSFAQEPDMAEVILPVLKRTDVNRKDICIQPLMIQVRRFYFGADAAYVSAFAKIDEKGSGGSVATLPGFEAGVSFRYYLGKNFTVYSGIGYVSRNFRVNAMGASFDQRNDRLCIPLLFSHRLSRNGPSWLNRTQVQLGAQIDLYRFRVPVTRLDPATGVQNTVTTSSKPEFLIVGGLIHYLPRVYKMKGSHTVSAHYSYGLTKTFRGEVGTPSQFAFRYSNAGSCLSVKYTYWFGLGFKKR